MWLPKPATPAVLGEEEAFGTTCKTKPKIFQKNFTFSKFSFHEYVLMSSQEKPSTIRKCLRKNVTQSCGGRGSFQGGLLLNGDKKFILQSSCWHQQRAQMVEGFHFPLLGYDLAKEALHQIQGRARNPAQVCVCVCVCTDTRACIHKKMRIQDVSWPWGHP